MRLQTYQKQALAAIEGYCPYQKSFHWVKGKRWEINKYSRNGLTRFWCVTKLIKHIDCEAYAFGNTTYVNRNCFWVHATLDWIYNKNYKAWMKNKGSWNCLIKPELEYNYIVWTMHPSKVICLKPTWNMPLDTSLNWAIGCYLNMYVLMMYHLKHADQI